MRNRFLNIGLMLVAYILTCAAVWFGPYFHEALTVNVGDVSNMRVIAPWNVENITATEENRREALMRANAMLPITVHEPAVDEEILNNLESVLARFETLRDDYNAWFLARDEEREAIITDWTQQNIQWELEHALWERRTAEGDYEDAGDEPVSPGPMPEIPDAEFPIEDFFTGVTVPLTLGQREFILNIDSDDFTWIRESVFYAAAALLEPPGITTIDERILLAARTVLAEFLDNADAVNVGYEIVINVLEPNMLFNEVADLAQREAIALDYEVVTLLQNETIVAEGERISLEAYTIMQTLGMLDAEWTRDIIPLLGIFVILAITMLACCWFVSHYHKRAANLTTDALLIFTLYIGILIILWAIDGIAYYFMPILIFTMLIAMLIDLRSAIVLNLGITISYYFVTDGDIQYVLFFMLSGTLICMLARYTNERNKIMLAALFSAVFNFVIASAISIAFEPHQITYAWHSILIGGGFAALNGMLTVIVAIGSLPLWEAVFGIVTPIKILDLTNPANPLMRRMTIEAPGTYHHSLIVANLAETAAYDIGANPHIARAGGYYHDIGKLKYPKYFAENITGSNPHDKMKPLDSSKIITSHVDHGVELANEYRLPQFIKDVIMEHHGGSLMKYFYIKAKESEGASEAEIKEADYRYSFSGPTSKESALVMLADGIEATVRSIMASSKNGSDLKKLIDKMIKARLTDGSLIESTLSIKDVDTIANAFYRVLKGMYHDRIPYPEEKEKEEAPAAAIPAKT